MESKNVLGPADSNFSPERVCPYCGETYRSFIGTGGPGHMSTCEERPRKYDASGAEIMTLSDLYPSFNLSPPETIDTLLEDD